MTGRSLLVLLLAAGCGEPAPATPFHRRRRMRRARAGPEACKGWELEQAGPQRLRGPAAIRPHGAGREVASGGHMRRLPLAAPLALALTACSFIAVRAPRREHLERCTSSRQAPVIDTVMTTLGSGVVALGAGVIIANSGPEEPGSDCCKDILQAMGAVVMTAGLAVAIPYGASAAYGYSTTARCRRMRAEAGFVPAPPPPVNGSFLR